MKIRQVFFLFLALFLAGALLVHGATDKELYEMGKTAYKSKRYSEAHDYFKRAVALKPTRAKYHYNLGLAARKLKSYGEAYIAFSKAKELDPQMKFTKKHRDFLNKLEEMRRRMPVESAPGRTDDGGAYAKGKAAYKNKQYQTAFDYFKQAAAAEPKKANRFYNLGLAARKLKNYQVAYASFLMAQQLDPQVTFTKKKQDFYNKLEEARKKSSQKKPAAKSSQSLSDYVYHEGLFKRGKELYKQKRYRDAYDNFKEAAGINRNSAKYQYNLGLAAYKLNLYLDAYNAFLKAEVLDPDLSFTTKKGEFRKKMEKVIQYRREQGDEAQKKKDLWTPGVGRDHTQRKGTFFTGRNILFMVFGFIALVIIFKVFSGRSRSRGADVMDRINRVRSTGGDYRPGGTHDYDDRRRYKDKWWKRKKYKKRKKRKLWRIGRRGDRSYVDHGYRDRDIYDDDRDSYNKYAAGKSVYDSLDRDGYETESGYYDAS